MIEIDFKEIEEFKTPDGNIWIINPLKRRDLKKLNRFTTLNDQLQKYKREGKTVEANQLVYGVDEENDEEETLLKVTDEIIDISIKNKKDGSKFPEKYRRQITKAMELCSLVIEASIDTPTRSKEGGSDTPLQMKSSGTTPE